MRDQLLKVGGKFIAFIRGGVDGLRVAASQRRIWPVSAHLAIYGAGTLVPVLGIVAYLLAQTAALQREQALRQAQVMASNLSDRVDRELEKAVAIGRTLATSRPLAQGDYAEFDEQAREVARLVDVVIAFRDLSGQQRTNTAAVRGQPLPVSNAEVLAVDRRVAELKRPVISDLLIDTVSKRHFVLVDVPAFKGADVVGFVNVAIYPEALSQLIGEDLSEDWIGGIVGTDGRRIARTKDHDRFIGTTNPRFLSIVRGNEGTWDGQTDEGIRISGAYHRSPLSGWITSVAVPEAELAQPLQRAFQWSIGLSVMAITLSVWLGVVFSQRIAKPIRALAEHARGLAGRAPPGASQFSIEEVEQVAEALRQTSLELVQRSAETARAHDAVRESEARYRTALSVGRMASWETNFATRQRIWSTEGQELFGLNLDNGIGQVGGPNDEYRAALHPEDRYLVDRYHALAKTVDEFDAEYRIAHRDGRTYWVAGRGKVVERDITGAAVRLINIVADITARKNAELHSKFLMNELSHRSKNLLSVVQAIAAQTAKNSTSFAKFDKQFRERLQGLALSSDVLVAQDWKSAPLRELVIQHLSAFGGSDSRRFTLSGPSVNLNANAAQAVGLALHELATNAAKYGALSSSTGKIDVDWSFTPSDPSVLKFEWIETGGPIVRPPGRKGFGHQVIERMTADAVNGTVQIDYAPAGLRWCLFIPLTALVLNSPEQKVLATVPP